MDHEVYVYIDESGDLGPHGSKYFSVVALYVKNPLEIARIIKKLRQKKLKKTIKQLSEIKANKADRRTKEFVLKAVKKANCDIFAVAVDKSQIMKHLFEVKNKLYNFICGILIKKLPINSKKIYIIIDKKHTNTLLQDDFNKYISTMIKEKKKDIILEIIHKDSYASNELQVTDFVVWAVNRKFNVGEDYYYNLFEDKVINKDNIKLW